MLVAPGYQYSQIDPNLTMTRDEHEAKFRVIRAAAHDKGYRWLASPIYQDFLAGDRKLPCAPWGSITRNPYGWKGPCYLLTDGIFPTYEALLDGIEWEEYGPGNDARCEHCAIHSGFEPLRRVRRGRKHAGERPQRRMDADRVTFACATRAERRVARRSGARSALVGLGAANGVPEGPVVSFGLAGALHDGLASGTVLDATRVVDAEGSVLWEGGPLGVPGAETATMLAADELVDDPAERRRLHELTGADAVDLESGPLARSGRLARRACARSATRPSAR